jgi:DNA-binding response OmpR family regulator
MMNGTLRDYADKGVARVKQVLVVDDSHVIRRLIEVVLGQVQLEVTTVATGTEACEALEREMPDMVILDLALPDISGWDVLEFVRGNPAFNDVAVIMLTGRSDADDIDRAAEMGADAYLLKPFRPDELRRIVVDTIHGAAHATA